MTGVALGTAMLEREPSQPRGIPIQTERQHWWEG